MTLEEAKQLRPGDTVLVEALVAVGYNGQCQFGERDNLFIVLCKNGEDGTIIYDENFVRCEDIREKITPQRRKFKAGDVVLTCSGIVMIAGKDEEYDPYALLIDNEKVVGETISTNRWDEITLICAAENRVDWKDKTCEQAK